MIKDADILTILKYKINCEKDLKFTSFWNKIRRDVLRDYLGDDVSGLVLEYVIETVDWEDKAIILNEYRIMKNNKFYI